MSELTTSQNLSVLERAVSAGLGGFALARYGRSSVLGTVLAAGLLQRAFTGHCAVYQALGVDTHDPTTPTFQRPSVKLSKAVTINAPPEQIYPFFTNRLEALVALSPEVVSLERLDDGGSIWTVQTPIGKHTFASQIVGQVENRSVAWRSDDNRFPHQGEVTLQPGPRGTTVRVSMEYQPPGGAPVAHLSRITGKEPHEALERTLYQLQSLLETGEIARSNTHPYENALAGKELTP
jgi:uncharacterized membrane protein